MRQQNSETKSPAIKIALWLTIILMIAILGVGVYFLTTSYFFKDQSNKGHVRFSPGIYVEFNSESVKIDQNSYNNWELLYYKNGDLTSTPIKLNNSGELAYPSKTYNILSPEFKSAADTNGESAPFVARAKIEYKDENDILLSEEKLNFIFDQTLSENNNGKFLEFANGWVQGSNGYYYYVGENTSASLDKDALKAIEYSEDAEYIKIFKTDDNNVAQLKIANQSGFENYQEYGISIIKIVLTMEFVEVESDVIDSWFSTAG